MRCAHIFLLVTYIAFSHSSIYSHVKDNLLSFMQRSNKDYNKEKQLEFKKEQSKDIKDARLAKAKASALKRVRGDKRDADDPRIYQEKNQNKDMGVYRMDHVLNFLSRRKGQPEDSKDKELSGESSSSLEIKHWKDEWREEWIQKKFEAINSTAPVGDVVNMVAARPWGVPCGDPNQHDMPWGSCMLPMECEAEFRIYRGDYFCGRTQFICCSLGVGGYDLYQGFDASFADSSLQTDSNEKRNREMASNERKRKDKHRLKRHRQRERMSRKRKIKKNIRKILKEVERILNRAFRNRTTHRKKKTRQLNAFVKRLKEQYKKDRKSVKNIHENKLIKIDEALQWKFNQITGLNHDFMHNETFRDIVVNGSVSPNALRMLVQAYPELVPMLNTGRRSNVRPDYLEYDIEYGLLSN